MPNSQSSVVLKSYNKCNKSNSDKICSHPPSTYTSVYTLHCANTNCDLWPFELKQHSCYGKCPRYTLYYQTFSSNFSVFLLPFA